MDEQRERVGRRTEMKEKGVIILCCILIFYAMLSFKIYSEHNPKNATEDYAKTKDVPQNGELYNAWIKEGEKKQLTAMVNNQMYEFSLAKNIGKLENVVADLKIKNGVVKKITLKEDYITGKVLALDEKSIEIEGYGRLSYGKGYKVYRTYEEPKQLEKEDVLVGYDEAKFVVAGKKVCAALIDKPVKVGNIRVLLRTNNGKDVYHSSVTVCSDTKLTLICGKKKTTYKKGENVVIKADKKYFGKEKRLKIQAEKGGKITVMSIKRGTENPSYRGSMELTCEKKKGLLLVNELSLEEYLYAVIGSEMPVSYGEEALKVQAVCARSYAYKQLIHGGCSTYGAHVDDSVSYQVYNQQPECEETIKAVDSTKGQILQYEGEAITAYYFSTSCGYTASAKEVWGTSQEEYLQGVAQYEGEKERDLSKEKAFKEFLKEDLESYDKDFPWYRWNVTMSVSMLSESVNQALSERYEKNKQWILTKQKDGSYASKPISTIGEITGISVLERGKSGVLKSIVIQGKKGTVKVISEYNIRTLLAPNHATIYRQDGSQVNGLDMLPSGFCYIEENRKKGTFSITGGGYGHGVGMSQNGTKTMVDLGYKYEEILEHYYQGAKIVEIED